MLFCAKEKKMLYNLIQTKRGEETIKMTDTLQKCNDRIKQLRASYRGKSGVSFRIKKSQDTAKFAAKPLKNFDPSGSSVVHPKIVRKKS